MAMSREFLASVLLCGMVSMVWGGLYPANSNVVNLNSKNFANKVMTTNEVWLVEFYAPWCGHCKQLAPQWEQAASKLKGLVNVGALNCDEEENKPLAGYYGIQGFPTIKVFAGDFVENPHQKGAPFKKPTDYQGPRSAKDIVGYALNQLKYYGTFTKSATVDEFLAGEGAKVILFTDKNRPSSLYRAASGKFNGRLSFTQVNTAEKSVMKRFGVESAPHLLVIDEEGGQHVYGGELAGEPLAAFLEQYAAPRKFGEPGTGETAAPPPPPARTPEVVQLDSQEDFDKQCGDGICAIALLNPEDEAREDQLAILDAVSQEYYKHMHIAWIDGLKFNKFCQEFGKGQDFPDMVITNSKRRVFTPFTGAFTVESMTAFISKVINGKRRSASTGKTFPKLE
mmetsp:Transcript_12404/g.35004  ORF Transcript_12404/g.35004 Transcript_12404/m.35004 type:complete len:396 (+) Transcript_12404:125-1312(+)|eukprot:CAMPEP_0119131392 /NCGR_PEP_ID=MMETSP1310-20130426/10294_1 /TAXON_ID=464262 /ORGANISM="Genus nov. species nov., Strain RCC2339" /LENGTH=395 /DNA_ID=CAMNT_0007121965 /DNA_START=97 /DNA_END=1284 /DNA_ORIENTATION=-